jgi:hypothetical protein
VTQYLEGETYSRAGDWIMSNVRRNPEAILLLAAGCALFMRSGGGASYRLAARRNVYGTPPRGTRSRYSSAGESPHTGAGLSQGSQAAAEYASDVRQRVSDTAGQYAEGVSQYADKATQYARDVGRTISDHSERLRRQAQSSFRQAQSSLQDGMSRVLREQPLAVAAAGLAAGAAVAALFPATKIENQAFGGAREALAEAAGKAGENLVGAAGQVGERLKSEATDRLKEMAGEVVETFASQVTGSKDRHVEATTVPQGPKSDDEKRKQSKGEAGRGVGEQAGQAGRSNR